MSRYRARRYIWILITVFLVVYVFVEYPYDVEIACAIIILYSLLLVVESMQFKKKRDQFIELGEQEHFDKKYIVSLLYYVFIICFIFFIGPKISGLGFLPPFRDELHTLFWVLLVPGILINVLRVFFKVKENSIYATEKGLLYGMGNLEFYFWEDFKSYKHISNQKLFRIEKKNSKRLYISYEEEHFNKNREAILAILDKKLTRE